MYQDGVEPGKIRCRKCERVMPQKKFRVYDPELFSFLTQFQRETCKFCWRGKPYNRVMVSRAKRRGSKAVRLYTKRRAQKVVASNRRRTAKINAMPKWANREAIKEIYKKALRVTIETGIAHHVDHIIPLRGRNVCGLHIESNLQVLPWRENISKGNRFCPNLLESGSY